MSQVNYGNQHVLSTEKQDGILFSPQSKLIFAAAIIASAALIAFFPSLNGDYLMDDDSLLTDNQLIKASDGLYRFWFTRQSLDYWPVTNSSLWLEWRLWGMNPIGYHLSNLILHISEALLIWMILRKLAIPGAFLAALLFAVHPVNVESVAWIAQRKGLLAMLFGLLSMLWYLEFLMRARLRLAAKPLSTAHCPPPTAPSPLAPRPSPLFYWLSLAAFILAMLSKGSVVILPLLLLGMVWWLRPLTKKDFLYIAPFFVVAVILALVDLWFQTHGSGKEFRSVTFAQRLLGAGGVVWFYLYKAILPLNLLLVYPQWRIHVGNPLWWLPLCAVVIVTVVFWNFRNSWARPFFFAWGFFCVSLLPILGLIDIAFMEHSPVADHYQHIAIIGVISLIAAGWSAWYRKTGGIARRTAVVLAVLTVAIFTFLSWRHSKLYANAMRLYQYTVEKNPECWLAHNNLGNLYFQQGRIQQAGEEYRRALQINPDSHDAHNNLGGVLSAVGRNKEAIEEYNKALHIRPIFPDAQFNLGMALAKNGDLDKAIVHFKNAAQIRPYDRETFVNLGMVLAKTARFSESAKAFQQALNLKPDDVVVLNNLGYVLLNARMLNEAIICYQRVLQLDRDNQEAGNYLGLALALAGRLSESIDHYQWFLRQNPNNVKAHNNLALALANMGRLSDAVEHYNKALELKPDYPEAHNNLGIVLQQLGLLEEAIEHFQLAISLNPQYLQAAANLAFAYAKAGESSEAIAAGERALELAQSAGQKVVVKELEGLLKDQRAKNKTVPNASESKQQSDKGRD